MRYEDEWWLTCIALTNSWWHWQFRPGFPRPSLCFGSKRWRREMMPLSSIHPYHLWTHSNRLDRPPLRCLPVPSRLDNEDLNCQICQCTSVSGSDSGIIINSSTPCLSRIPLVLWNPGQYDSRKWVSPQEWIVGLRNIRERIPSHTFRKFAH